MEDKGIWVFDIECDGLLKEASKIHCLCAINTNTQEKVVLTSYDDMKEFYKKAKILIGHNIVGYDIPVSEKLLGIKIDSKLIDTLGLSWSINSSNTQITKHGLESWGEYYGVPKPKISDWENLSVQDYIHRCSTDCEINLLLWKDQQSYLLDLYDSKEDLIRFIDYITFKLDCVREQEEVGVKLDIEKCKKAIEKLEAELQPKQEALRNSMPKNPIYKIKSKPKNMYRKDGELTSLGEKWLDFLTEQGLGPSYEGPVKYIDSYEDGNPNSTQQIKDWLYSLGWEPEHIKFVRDKKTNEFSQIPQIKHKTDKGDICDSIKKLYHKEPALENLSSMTVIAHRISVLKGFLESHIDGYLYPSMNGFTNTMRLKHRVIVNLPKPSELYASDIRDCLICEDGELLCGSDLSSIEDSTKQHYIYKYDPDYVNEMRVDDYDPHLDIAMRAGFLTKEQVDEHKKGIKSYKEERQKGKGVNFSATYKVGANTLSRNFGFTLTESKNLLKTYWDRNKAILDVERDVERKTIGNQLWIKNPISRFWYSLRAEKDIFSTLNQGSAVYVFDVWVGFIRKKGIKLSYQCHDEHLSALKEGDKDLWDSIIRWAMDKVNEKLKLNVPIGCSIDFGKTYKEVH